MRKAFFLMCCFGWLSCYTGHAQVLLPQAAESQVTFTIKNFGLKTTGSFTGLAGQIRFAPQQIEQSFFDITVPATSVNTQNNSRDKHLRKADYFSVEQYPLIRITGKAKLLNDPQAGFQFEGQLSLKGVTKKISFPFTATPQKEGFLFRGTFVLNRQDHGVGGKSFSLSDFVEINLSVLAK